MRSYNGSKFAVGICFLCLGVFSVGRGVSSRNGFDILMGVLYGGVGVAYIRISMNKERAARDREASERSSQAARRRFGKLALPIHFLGFGLAVPGLILILMRHPMLGLLLILAGTIYTLVIEQKLKQWAEWDTYDAWSREKS
nr:hypothetical protein [uncultured Oscillibacter sp.]